MHTEAALDYPNPAYSDVNDRDEEILSGRLDYTPKEGVNLFLADGEAAMQEVFHSHLHVFPRYRGDGFGLRFGPDYKVRPRADLERAANRIRSALDAGA